jgi:hypothetical protein
MNVRMEHKEIKECGTDCYAVIYKNETTKRMEQVDPFSENCNQAKGRNFSSTSSMIGDFSRTCAIEGGRLRFMLPE